MFMFLGQVGSVRKQVFLLPDAPDEAGELAGFIWNIGQQEHLLAS